MRFFAIFLLAFVTGIFAAPVANPEATAYVPMLVRPTNCRSDADADAEPTAQGMKVGIPWKE